MGLMKTMEAPFYPEISEEYLTPLMIVLNSVREYPDYLGRGCPYSSQVKQSLWSVLNNASTTVDNAPVASYLGHHTDKWSAVELERVALYQELQDLRTSFEAGDTTEHLQTIKTMVTVLDKLTEIGERSKWMKEVAAFRKYMLDIMENVLTPDQRTEVMAKAKAILMVEGI